MSDELIQELEDLADEWRQDAERLSDTGNTVSSMWNKKRAGELQELIADYGDTDE